MSWPVAIAVSEYLIQISRCTLSLKKAKTFKGKNIERRGVQPRCNLIILAPTIRHLSDSNRVLLCHRESQQSDLYFQYLCCEKRKKMMNQILLNSILSALLTDTKVVTIAAAGDGALQQEYYRSANIKGGGHSNYFLMSSHSFAWWHWVPEIVLNRYMS